jgi:hypothetical protein
VRTFRFLIRRRNLTDLAFGAGFFLASCFYSLHNKPYFYLYLVTVALLIATEPVVAESPVENPAEGEPDLAPAGSS